MYCITVVTPIDHFCGKSFALTNDGKITKGKAAVTAKAKAKNVPCSNLGDLAAIINGLQSGEAIILGYIRDLFDKNVSEFNLISEKEMMKLTNSKGLEDTPLIHYKNGEYYAQRKKKIFSRAPFFCIDRDVDENVPDNIKRVQELSNSEFLRVLCQELGPDVGRAFHGADFLPVVSSSGQVFSPGGVPYSADPSAHLYFQVDSPEDLDRFAVVLLANAFGSGFLYEKQLNRKDDIKAFRRCTIYDPSVFTVGRLFFESAPRVSPGLTVKRQPCSVVKWEGKAVKTQLVPEPQGEILLTQNLSFKRNGKLGSHLESDQLPRNLLIETKNGPMTPEQFEKSGMDRLRCQSPFRDSDSWAAYLNRHDNGSCFLFDSGTNIKYNIEPEPIPDTFSQLIENVKAVTREVMQCPTDHVMIAREEIEASAAYEPENVSSELSEAIKGIEPIPPSVLDGVWDFGDDVSYGAPFLIQNFIPKNATGVIFGPPGSLKSFGVLDMGLSVAHGLTTWCGNKIAESGGVLYFSGEGKRGIGGRVKAWMKKNKIYNYSPNFRFYNEQLALTGDNGQHNAQKIIDTARHTAAITGENIKLIIFDTLARAMGDGDENKAADMQAFCNMAEAIRDQIDCCVLIVHHTQKNFGKSSEMKARGSGALSGAVDFEYVYYRVDQDENEKDLDICVKKDEYLLKLDCKKMKDAKEPKGFYLKGVIVETGTFDNFGEPETAINIVGPAYGGIADEAIAETKAHLGETEKAMIQNEVCRFLLAHNYNSINRSCDIDEAAIRSQDGVNLILNGVDSDQIISAIRECQNIGFGGGDKIWVKHIA
ncbi:helicase RepA family protein [Photobacterium damselae]|uniref:helicase RepA family protein n=1 Tax=Photobacterium damselae TaxID=38293 RepID=UPI001F28AC0A|nr:helicase RepA family protein [Photobacterium damselae]UKA12959.1 helicase RepA family protein [Photobacterium damselae subsp. damselae]